VTTVLMYHALYKGDDTSRIDSEDLPYAVSEQNFIQQLDFLREKKVGLLDTSSATQPDVVITFDDGHISNFDIAMPLLAERGMNAYLFITSDFVGRRAHFCHAHHLQKMAAAGMVIGSHGKTHLFFDDLSDADAECELAHSKAQLSDQCGIDVKSISYPGGRYNSSTLSLSRKQGYSQLFGSKVGRLKHSDLTAIQPLKRVAIRRGTSLKEFSNIVSADPIYYVVQQGKQNVKLLVKRALGNHLYHGLYRRIKAR